MQSKNVKNPKVKEVIALNLNNISKLLSKEEYEETADDFCDLEESLHSESSTQEESLN